MLWDQDLVKQVPSNLKVSLVVAERVYKNLEIQNIADVYAEVFSATGSLDIIEPMKQKVPNQIWIPHRPVIKNEANLKAKIRHVFNYSLKMGKAPSTNGTAPQEYFLLIIGYLYYCTLDLIFTYFCLTLLRCFFRSVWHLTTTRTDFVSVGRFIGNLYLIDTVLSFLDLFLAPSFLIMLYSIIYQLILLILSLL